MSRHKGVEMWPQQDSRMECQVYQVYVLNRVSQLVSLIDHMAYVQGTILGRHDRYLLSLLGH